MSDDVQRWIDDLAERDRLARVLVDRGELEAAFNEWGAVLQLDADHVGAIKGMAFIRFRQGLLDEAERLLMQAHARGADASITAAIDTVRAAERKPQRMSDGNGFQSFLTDVSTAVAEHLSAIAEPVIAAPQTLRVADNFFMDHEKVVWHWPDLNVRLNEDVR